MKSIALIAQKGGVGKTTLAVNLAVASGLKTALFDLDQQESAVMWADRRKADLPHVEFLTERRLPEALKAAEAQGFDWPSSTPPQSQARRHIPPRRRRTSCSSHAGRASLTSTPLSAPRSSSSPPA